MGQIIFRKSALDKISSLDQLDQTMKVIKPYDIIAVAAMAVIVLAAVIWSIVGSIPESVSAMGVLISTDDVIDVKYTNQGSVKNVFVERGDMIKNGEVIARIERTDMLDQMTQIQTTIENLLKTQELLNQNVGYDKITSNLKSARAKAINDIYNLITQAEAEAESGKANINNNYANSLLQFRLANM